MKAVVCGASGFIGGHLMALLAAKGFSVVGLDRELPRYPVVKAGAPLVCHEIDLRFLQPNYSAFEGADCVFQLAAEVGGLGYIMDTKNDAEILHNSMQINMNVLEACRHANVGRVLFTSSACVYHSMSTREENAYPYDPKAQGANAYAAEKLFSELLYQSYSYCYGMKVRIARLHNCYGTHGTWTGGREKAPAAICRKVAEAKDGDAIEVWGDGLQTRSFMYVDDAIEGFMRLMESSAEATPINIGSSQMVTVDEMVRIVIQHSGKNLSIKHVEGPVGVSARTSDNTRCLRMLNWEPKINLWNGLGKTYAWIKEQVEAEKK